VVAIAVSALAVLAVPALASQPIAGGSYAGKTSQGEKVSLRVSSSGKRVKSFENRLKGSCSDGTSFNGRFVQGDITIKIDKDGRFGGNGTIKGAPGSRIVGGHVTIRGRFRENGKVAKGTVHESVDITGGTCDTGSVTFKATLKDA
jgi:hypothetical protein